MNRELALSGSHERSGGLVGLGHRKRCAQGMVMGGHGVRREAQSGADTGNERQGAETS